MDLPYCEGVVVVGGGGGGGGGRKVGMGETGHDVEWNPKIGIFTFCGSSWLATYR